MKTGLRGKTGKTIIGILIAVFMVVILLVRLFCVKSEPLIDLDAMTVDGLTEEEIICHYDCYKGFLIQIKKQGSSTGVTDGDLSEADRDTYILSADEITGTKTISATLVKDATLSLSVDSKLLSGKLKIVVIMDERIVEYVDVNSKCKLTYTVAGEHLIYVKILGEKAQMEINVTRELKR